MQSSAIRPQLSFPSCPLLFSAPSSTYCFLRPLSAKNAFADHNQAFNNSSYKHWESSTVDQHSKIYICSATQQQSQQVAQNATLQLRDESGLRLRLLPFYGCHGVISRGKKCDDVKLNWREQAQLTREKIDGWKRQKRKMEKDGWMLKRGRHSVFIDNPPTETHDPFCW